MAHDELDSIDRRILQILQTEGRIANTTLAERVGLSPSPCLRRVAALERRGAITGYRAELDRPAVGLGLTVYVGIKVAGHSRAIAEQMEAALAEIPEVISAHLLSGPVDFLCEVVVPDLPAYERLLLDTLLVLPGVTDLSSNIAIRTVKDHTPLPLAHVRAPD